MWTLTLQGIVSLCDVISKSIEKEKHLIGIRELQEGSMGIRKHGDNRRETHKNCSAAKE